MAAAVLVEPVAAVAVVLVLVVLVVLLLAFVGFRLVLPLLFGLVFFFAVVFCSASIVSA